MKEWRKKCQEWRKNCKEWLAEGHRASWLVFALSFIIHSVYIPFPSGILTVSIYPAAVLLREIFVFLISFNLGSFVFIVSETIILIVSKSFFIFFESLFLHQLAIATLLDLCIAQAARLVDFVNKISLNEPIIDLLFQ